MVHLPDRIYLQRRKSLPVTLSALVLFPAFLLKHDDFRVTPMVYDRRRYLGSVNYGRADFLSRGQYI
jgi:hypothetical protein